MVGCACGPSYLGGWSMRIAWTQEVEVAVSWDWPLPSGLGDRVRLHIKKGKKIWLRKTRMEICNFLDLRWSNVCEFFIIIIFKSSTHDLRQICIRSLFVCADFIMTTLADSSQRIRDTHLRQCTWEISSEKGNFLGFGRTIFWELLQRNGQWFQDYSQEGLEDFRRCFSFF